MRIRTLVSVTGLAAAALLLSGCNGDSSTPRDDAPVDVQTPPGDGLVPDTTTEGDPPAVPGG